MSSIDKLGSKSSSVLHIFAGERLQAFSDAVFAIIATLMVIPLKLKDEDVKENGGVEGYRLEDFLVRQWSRYLVYLYSFTLVVDMWYSHVGIFSIVEQVDDVIIWLNLLCLMLVSFLPYGTGLVSSYPDSGEGQSLAITICSLDLLLIGLCMFLILLYAFRRQSLLHPEIEADGNIVSIRRASIIAVLITPCMSLLSLCFSFLYIVPYISLLLFYSVGITSFFTRLAVYLYYKKKRKIENLPCHLFNSVGSTLRTEAFSDGVFSIVATLIVLDLTTEGMPSAEEVNEGNLNKALRDQRYVIISYVTSFVTVGLLWFVHYGMVHFIVRLTPALSFVNNLCLFLIGGIPFVSGIDTIFSDIYSIEAQDKEYNGPYTNKSVSIRCFCVLVFLVGIGQLLFWTLALFQKEKCMSKRVDEHCSESLQFCKIMVFPVVCFIIFWCTYSEDFMYYSIYNYLLFFTPFIFLLLKVLFRKHDSAVRRVRMWRYQLQGTEVNSRADEKTTLVRGKAGESDTTEIEIPTTHVRLIGKGDEVDVEITTDSSASRSKGVPP